MNILIKNARIVNEGEIFDGSVIIENGFISEIIRDSNPQSIINYQQSTIIDANGKTLIPGVIDTHVHFREPGLTHKGDMFTESKAAISGGVTSFFDMPNTIPNAVNIKVIEEKNKLAEDRSFANYSFFIGASNSNSDEILKLNPEEVCGVKLFLGASTGNMLVDDDASLTKLFSEAKLPLAVHCEDESIIKKNLEDFKNRYGEDIPVSAHPDIRSEEACYKSTAEAIIKAKKNNTRLQIMHVSTGKETELFDNNIPISEKRITSETCVNYLIFSKDDYNKYGSLIKCNPAIKTASDKKKLLDAVNDGRIDVISSDHAPHTFEEKQNKYLKAPSGIPSVQHTLVAMLELYHKNLISLEKIIECMCHNPAICYNISKRGFIRKGYWADLVLLDLDAPWTVDKSNILYKCGWSPFEGFVFKSKVTNTFVNGNHVFDNGIFDNSVKGFKITFDRE